MVPIANATQIIMKKYGLCSSENCKTVYLAISFAPESDVVIMPSGLMRRVAIMPTTTPTAIARIIGNGSDNWKVSIMVVDTPNVATAKMQSFSILKPRTPNNVPATIGIS